MEHRLACSTGCRQTGLAVQIRDSLFAFPLLEAAHVIGLALVFGTIAIVDLRLLGVASTHRSFQRLASDTLKWTWAAFVVTAVTGALMFITNAPVYFHNAYFRAKVALLVLAAINALVFELTARRTVAAMGSGALGASARSSRGDRVARHLGRRHRHRPHDRLHGHARVAGRTGARRTISKICWACRLGRQVEAGL